MTTYGLTPTGFVKKPLSQVYLEIDAALQTIVGTSAGTNPDGTIPDASIAGQLKVLFTDGIAAMWDIAQLCSTIADPASVTGQSQDQLCALTGSVRRAGTFSTATVYCTGTPGTVLPALRRASVAVTGTVFDTVPQVTLAAATAWTQSTGYTIGQVVTANSKVYYCSQTGTSSNAGTGPNGTTYGSPITDGGAQWQYLGGGTAYATAAVIAEVIGALGANSYTLTQILTPVSGWQGVANVANAQLGTPQESDGLFRVRQQSELSLGARSVPDAIKAYVLAVNQTSTDPNHQPPTTVKVLFNDSDITDVNGLPPHSVEVIFLGGTVADVALAIWQAVGAGINLNGTSSTTITDSSGNTQTVKYTVPTQVPIYVITTVYYDPSKWPATGAAALVQQAALSALLTFGATYPVGQSVRTAPLIGAILDGPSATDTNGNAIVPAPAGSAPLPGGLDVTPIYIGTAPGPATSTPITITVRQIATFSLANMTITATPESP